MYILYKIELNQNNIYFLKYLIKWHGTINYNKMISVIITAFKEPKTIGKAIEQVVANNLWDYEIIVCAPDEETLNVAREYSKNNPKIRTLVDPGKWKPTALNLVFGEAKWEILVLSDWDVYVNDDAVTKLIEPFKDKSVWIVTWRPMPTNSRDNMLWYWAHLLTETWAHRIRTELQEQGRFISCSGYLMAIRAWIIDKIPENALSDDAVISNLVYNSWYKTAYAPEAIVNVKFPTSFNDWIKQKKRSAGWYNQMKTIIDSKDEMRSFTKESSKIMRALTYPKNFLEFIWTILLVLARLYLWLLIFIDINILKKDFKKVWVRIESTK